MMTTITNLVENAWMTRYHRKREFTHDQGSEFIGHEFKNPPIQKQYGIKANPIWFRNPTYNDILEIIQPVLENSVHIYNIKEVYVDKDELWMGILTTTEFEIISTANRLKYYSPIRLIFGSYMILPIR